MVTIAMIPTAEDGSETHIPTEETWHITKRDLTVPVDAGLRVMDHADMVLQKRLSHASPELLDIFHFESSVARFDNTEIKLGNRIAFGNFADIYLIDAFHHTKSMKRCTPEQLAAAEHLKENSKASSLVVKLLRSQLLTNASLYATGAADVVTEGTLLATLDHPNILSLKGRSVSSMEAFASGKRDAFFLILEKVDGNLVDRLKDWQKRCKGRRGNLREKRTERCAVMIERIQILTQLASAMEYLHDRRIIHRDLKLTNVGIDATGRPKLLDFGLAKVLPNGADKETFLLTKNTGSVRYMAPEIGRGEPYNLKADVYSFAILLYEILNLSKVFPGWTPNDIRERVHIRKARPQISMFWPAELKELLRTTWSDIPAARLSMTFVHAILSKFLDELLQEENS